MLAALDGHGRQDPGPDLALLIYVVGEKLDGRTPIPGGLHVGVKRLVNERVAEGSQQYRLSYSALARQYRVGVGTLYQNFGSLPEALAFLSRVRLRDIAEPGALAKGVSYVAALRMRLDTSQLPKPFQVTAVGSRDWNVSSDWYRWTVMP